MSSKSVFSRVHSHLLGIALIGGGIALHMLEPYVKDSVENVASNPNVLAVRASYHLVVGDIDSALRVATKAAQPSKSSSVVRSCPNHS